MQTCVSSGALSVKDRKLSLDKAFHFSFLSVCELQLLSVSTKSLSCMLCNVLINVQTVSSWPGTLAEIQKVHICRWGGGMGEVTAGGQEPACLTGFLRRLAQCSNPFSPHSVTKHVMPY